MQGLRPRKKHAGAGSIDRPKANALAATCAVGIGVTGERTYTTNAHIPITRIRMAMFRCRLVINNRKVSCHDIPMPYTARGRSRSITRRQALSQPSIIP